MSGSTTRCVRLMCHGWFVFNLLTEKLKIIGSRFFFLCIYSLPGFKSKSIVILRRSTSFNLSAVWYEWCCRRHIAAAAIDFVVVVGVGVENVLIQILD